VAQVGLNRRFTPIFSADIKEHSRLMSQYERHTIRTITAFEEAITIQMAGLRQIERLKRNLP
jgi:hypothetical protein